MAEFEAISQGLTCKFRESLFTSREEVCGGMKTIKLSCIALLLLAFSFDAAFAEVSPERFFEMLESNDIGGVRLAIRDGFEIDKIYKKERESEKTPLLEAIKLANPGMARMLLENGADVEFATADDMTPLLWSIFWAAAGSVPNATPQRKKDSMEIFDLMLEYKADVNYVNIFGWCPLGYAANSPYYDCALPLAKKLLDAGADPNIPLDKSGLKAKAMRLMPSAPPSSFDNLETSDWMPPLMWALLGAFAEQGRARENRAELIKLLLDAGADPNGRSKAGTPLHVAAAIDYELSKMLLDAGADKTAKDEDGKTPFDVAREHMNILAMALLF
ncbi:MAG: ankyrin repeat domain-containing protein [Synergistaceae bacterium]|nr:ankyrin repeat domain-containing protein [Synergistaceae bacterium]